MPGSPIEIFAKLDGIEGESAIRGHEKETIVVSYEQGLEQQPSTPSGGGGSTGRAVFPGVRFRKPVDIGSVPLMLACAGGTRLREARFTFRRSGGAGLDFYRVTLEDVLVARVVERAGTGLQYPLLFETLTSGADGGGRIARKRPHCGRTNAANRHDPDTVQSGICGRRAYARPGASRRSRKRWGIPP